MQRPSVLVVIDNPDEAEMYVVGLGSAGFDARASRADQLFSADAVDLLVVDDTAAGPAWDWLKEFCGREDGPPTILLTAHVEEDRTVRDGVVELRCAGFVAKPCTPAALADVLRRVLAGERGIEEIHTR